MTNVNVNVGRERHRGDSWRVTSLLFYIIIVILSMTNAWAACDRNKRLFKLRKHMLITSKLANSSSSSIGLVKNSCCLYAVTSLEFTENW